MLFRSFVLSTSRLGKKLTVSLLRRGEFSVDISVTLFNGCNRDIKEKHWRNSGKAHLQRKTTSPFMNIESTGATTLPMMAFDIFNMASRTGFRSLRLLASSKAQSYSNLRCNLSLLPQKRSVMSSMM